MKTIYVIMGLAMLDRILLKNNAGPAEIDTAIDSLINFNYGDDPKQAWIFICRAKEILNTNDRHYSWRWLDRRRQS